MTRWSRATSETLCGGFGPTHTIPVGAPLFVIQLPGVKRVRFRCEVCAGGPVPPDLPPLSEAPSQRRTKRMLRLAAKMRTDYKSLAAMVDR